MTAGRTPCTAGYTAADWRAWAAHRADPRGEEPEGWAAALDHLDRCADCRRAALAADPTLVFRRLRAAPVAPAAADPEAAAMRQAVAALREASRLGATAGAGREVAPRRGARRTAWTRAAAAASLVAATLAASSGRVPHLDQAMAPLRASLAPAAAAPTVLSAAILRAAPAALAAAPAEMPLLEETNRPDARVYQFEDPDYSFAWIVDKKLDV
jgi:hypothetical protein